MNIKPENSEIRTQHYMDAQGQSDLKPTEKEIEDYLNSRGFKSIEKIDISFDDFQDTWRWYTKIKELKMSTFKEYLEKTSVQIKKESDEKFKKECSLRLSQFFRVPITNLKNFNFDGKDNIKDLTKALKSTSDKGTELYYNTVIKLVKEDLG